MKKFRIVKRANYTYEYYVQRRYFGFLWITVKHSCLFHEAEEYVQEATAKKVTLDGHIVVQEYP